MGDLLSLPQQAARCQDFVQPGATLSRHVAEASVYHNQLDQAFPRVFDDFDEYPRFVPRQRDFAYFPVDERKRVPPRPSTPIVSPARFPRSRMLCPLISVTSDNEISSIIYQDENDTSDDRMVEEEESDMSLDYVPTSSLNCPTDNTLNPFETITAPPKEYAETANDYQHPLTFDGFDAIPYIDQTDDGNLAKCRVQIGSSDKCEGCNKAVKIDCDNKQILNVPLSHLETATYSNPNFLSVESTLRSKLEDSSHLRAAKHVLNEDRVLDDVFNSEDCADESSSTVNDDCASNRVEEEGISTPKMYTIMPELHLDLSGLNSDVSSDESKTEKCWKSPEEVRLGCGRVAALAKHFSKLGDAGLIKFKSTKLIDSRQFVSEPNITLSGKDGERHLHHSSCYVQKEYKSDSNLTGNSANKNPRICPTGRHVIFIDVDADRNDFAIGESHQHGAKRVTIARIPLMSSNKDPTVINTEERDSGLAASIENTSSKDQGFSQKDATFVEIEDDNMATDNDKPQICTDAESSKLSLDQQRAIAEQLEQFSNLNNTDAPLFIPEQSAKRIPSLKNENVTYSLGDSNDLAIDADDSFRRAKRASDTSSSSSPSPSSSIVLSLSNVAKSSSFPEEIGSQAHQYWKKHPKSCLFIDIHHSSAKLHSDSSENPSKMLPSAHKHNKLNILRMRIAKSLCSSENNLIGAVICEKEEIQNLRDESAKLTRSCESIPNSKFLSDSVENLNKDIDSHRAARNRSGLKEKTPRWYRPCSLEELKSKKGSKKQDNSALSRTLKDRADLDKSDCENNGKGMRRKRHLSLEELKSERESREQSDRRSSSEIAQVTKSEWTLRKRFRAKLRERLRRSETTDEKRQKRGWRVGERECRSELDVSRRRSDDSEGNDWRSFREISSMRDDDRSTLRKPHPNTCVNYAFDVHF